MTDTTNPTAPASSPAGTPKTATQILAGMRRPAPPGEPGSARDILARMQKPEGPRPLRSLASRGLVPAEPAGCARAAPAAPASAPAAAASAAPVNNAEGGAKTAKQVFAGMKQSQAKPVAAPAAKPGEAQQPAPSGDVPQPAAEFVEAAPVLEAVAGIAAELKLDAKAAQPLADRVVAAVQARETAIVRAKHTAWNDEIARDPELGAEAIEAARGVLRQFGGDDPALAAAMRSVYGSFPPLVRWLARVGKHVRERDAEAQAAARRIAELTAQLERTATHAARGIMADAARYQTRR